MYINIRTGISYSLRRLAVWPALHIFKCRYRSYNMLKKYMTIYSITILIPMIFPLFQWYSHYFSDIPIIPMIFPLFQWYSRSSSDIPIIPVIFPLFQWYSHYSSDLPIIQVMVNYSLLPAIFSLAPPSTHLRLKLLTCAPLPTHLRPLAFHNAII